MKYKLVIEFDNLDGYNPATIPELLQEVYNGRGDRSTVEVTSMEPIPEVFEQPKPPVWTCDGCGTNCFPDYHELEQRVTMIKEIVGQTVYLGDTLDYLDPDDMPGPTHWFMCPDCGHRTECSGYHIEPM